MDAVSKSTTLCKGRYTERRLHIKDESVRVNRAVSSGYSPGPDTTDDANSNKSREAH